MNVALKRSQRRSLAGLTAVEALAILVGILVFLWVGMSFLLHFDERSKRNRVKCVNNLKNVALGFAIYAIDNDGFFPAGATNGLQPWALEPYSAFRHFTAVSNVLITPRLIVCPSDTNKVEATNFANVTNNQSVGYFIGLLRDRGNPNSILSGDAYLTNSTAPVNGFLTVRTNERVGWGRPMHKEGDNVALGNGGVVFEKLKSGPDAVFKASGGWPDRLALPIER